MYRKFIELSAILLILLVGASAPMESAEEESVYSSPVDLVASQDEKRLYVAEATAHRITELDPIEGKVLRQFALPGIAGAVALSKDGNVLYAASAIPQGEISVFDLSSGKKVKTIRAGHTPSSLVVSLDGKTLYVCNRFDDNVSFVEIESGRVQHTVAVTREPVAAALSADGRRLFVANHLPKGAAHGEYVAAVVSMIDTESGSISGRIELPNGSTGLRGLCLSHDGAYVYVTHILARYQVPTTQLERGWMNTNALSVIDAQTGSWINTVLLDDVDLGAANPWGVASAPCETQADATRIVVTHGGSHEISVIDAEAMHEKLDRAARDPKGNNVCDDLSFLVGIRRRIVLPGNGPRGIALAGDKVYVAEYFSDSIAIVDLGSDEIIRPQQVSLNEIEKMSATRLGEMYFFDANCCFQKWQSCASCHPDGRADALNWDLLNDGMGNPKQTKSLLFSHRTPPAMITGVRARAEDAVRAGLKYIQFTVRDDVDAQAIDAYLDSLEPIPSPYLDTEPGSSPKFVDRSIDLKNEPTPNFGDEPGSVSRLQRGKEAFEKARCDQCHNGPMLTNLEKYDVGTGVGREEGRAFDTPTLLEIWRTAPYLYDGRAATMEEVLVEFNPDDRHGVTSELTPQELADLVAFVLSL